MTITITTDGGFTGRGIGGVSVDSEIVRDAFHKARPETWAREYLSIGADLVTYTIAIGEHRTSWQTGAAIPRDLEELFEAVWARK